MNYLDNYLQTLQAVLYNMYGTADGTIVISKEEFAEVILSTAFGQCATLGMPVAKQRKIADALIAAQGDPVPDKSTLS